ncbi:MAG: saccharopine dehydrogenase NADP-binding domain-containing protein [Pseudomonadota bacterium]
MRNVLILGGYGNFGKRIARALVKASVPVIIAGRDRGKAEALCAQLGPLATPAAFDVNGDLAAQLTRLQPCAVVNTCGPFQNADYRVAATCIAHAVHCVDLADGRAFVTGITQLDAAAKAKDVSVISGASTVPGLSSAVLEHFKHEFATIDSLRFGISPGQKAERGLATTQGILTYVGKPLAPFAGHPCAYGWQDVHRQEYPGLGKRWMANCDIPDLDVLPAYYGIRAIQFSAGLELAPLHLGLWALAWLVRLGLPLNLPKHAPMLLKASNWFDPFGSADGGMHMAISGTAPGGTEHKRQWFIVAKDGYGPHIPTIPAIVLAKKIAAGTLPAPGAYPCVAQVSLAEYLEELAEYPITTTSI